MIRSYYREISRFPLLSPVQEKILGWRWINDKDRSAVDELVVHNLRLVVSESKKYVGRGLKMDELISAGNVGLIKGAERFDPALGCRFSTYATWWIDQTIERVLNIESPNNLIHIPTTVRVAAAKLRDDPYNEDLITAVAGKKDENIQRVREQIESRGGVAFGKRLKSLDYEYTDKRGETYKASDFVTHKGESVDDLLILEESREEKREGIKRVLARANVKERDRDTFTAYNCLDGRICQPTLQQLGDESGGLTREAVRQRNLKVIKAISEDKELAEINVS